MMMTCVKSLMTFVLPLFAFMVSFDNISDSRVWSGQDAAFRFYMAILGVLIFVNQTDPELA